MAHTFFLDMSTVTEAWRLEPCALRVDQTDDRRRQRRPAAESQPLVVSAADSVHSGRCPWFRGDGAWDAALAHLAAFAPDAAVLGDAAVAAGRAVVWGSAEVGRVEADCYADGAGGRCVHLRVVSV
jgi:hypothetical protein